MRPHLLSCVAGNGWAFLTSRRRSAAEPSASPGGTNDAFDTGGGRADVVSTMNAIEATVSQFTGALTYGLTDRIDVSLAVP